jgi:DNA polymerase III delta prime subunit
MAYQPKLNMNLFKNKRYQRASEMLEQIWFNGISPFRYTFEEVMKETGLSYEDVYSIQMFMLTFNS